MIDFRGLGEFQVQVGQAPVPLSSPRPRALLAVLLASANETVSAPSLIGELWPDGPPRHTGMARPFQVSAVAATGSDRVMSTPPDTDPTPPSNTGAFVEACRTVRLWAREPLRLCSSRSRVGAVGLVTHARSVVAYCLRLR